MVFSSDELVILCHLKVQKIMPGARCKEGGRAAFPLSLTLSHFHMVITVRSMFKVDAHIPFFSCHKTHTISWSSRRQKPKILF